MTLDQRNTLLAVFQQMAEFARKIGATEEITTFQKLHAALLSQTIPTKQIQEQAWSAKAKVAFKVARVTRSLSNAKQISEESTRLARALGEALFPPKPGAPPEIYVKGLAGNDEATLVIGATDDAPHIAARAIQVVQEFSSAVFKKDYNAAFALCADELRSSMNLTHFQDTLEDDACFGGPAIQCDVERINLLYADNAARQKPNKDGFWPKNTPKENKRATVGAFWFTQPAQQIGRWIAFWVTEQQDGYRIAKFQQHLQ